jgi:hypothetical protein
MQSLPFHVASLTHHVKTAMRLILCQVPVFLPSNFQNILLYWILDLFIMSMVCWVCSQQMFQFVWHGHGASLCLCDEN